MTVEQKLKLALGEQQFNLIVLSSQLEEAKKQIAELSNKLPNESKESIPAS